MEILWDRSLSASLPVPHRFERVRSLMNREGVARVLRIGSQRLWSHLFEVRKATVFGRSLDEPIPDYIPSVPVKLREMTLEDLSRFREARSLLPERWIMGFAERLKTGRIGIIGFVNGQVACYGWLSLQNAMDRWMGVELCLQDGEGYLYDGFIFPAFRGRGIYTFLQAWRLNYLKQLNCRIAYLVVAAGNLAAQRTDEKVGFIALRELCSVKIMKVTWHRNRLLGRLKAQTPQARGKKLTTSEASRNGPEGLNPSNQT